MNQTMEVKVPDIGDFKDVAVIEILVKVGDTVTAEQSLIALETDKAAMDVPSPVAGVVTSVSIKTGDKVSAGALVATIEIEAAAPAPTTPAAAATAALPPAAPAAPPPESS